MQRWLAGAGVVVVALVGAVLFFPSTDTGARIAEHSREQVPVEKLRKADPADLERARATLDAKRDRLRKDDEPSLEKARSGQLAGRHLASSERYRLQLADHGLTRKEVWKPWNDLDQALDATDSKEGMELRRQLVELERMTNKAFDDPRALPDLLAYQGKLLRVMTNSPAARDQGVQKALEALQQHHKQLAADINKL